MKGVEWVEEQVSLNGVDWVADGTLGDAYTDCMSSCIGACNDMNSTEPGALQACIAACPTTCYLYKVPAGGTPNKPSTCMQKCLADANALSDPTARTAAIAACPSTCKLQQAATCPAGYTKDQAGKCVQIGPIACASNANCKEGEECVQGQCVPACPQGQTRKADGSCGPVVTSEPAKSNWGLAVLGLGAAAALFFGLKASQFGGGPTQAERPKANPRRRRAA